MFLGKGSTPKTDVKWAPGVVDADVFLEIATHEAIIRQAYKDSVGVWTWSIGITSASGHKVERYIDNPAPMKKCIEVAQWLLEGKYTNGVRQAFGDDFEKLTKNQFTAALSFHWNTGGIRRAKWVKSFRQGNTEVAYKQFMNWSKPKAIIPRREKERDLFFDNIWTNKGTITEFTRLHSSYTPDFNSGRQVDVRKYL